jgi:acyl-CoA synthetase (AMP-forming)/AMP-acid ligase II
MNIVEPIFVHCRSKPSELALCAPGADFNLVSYARLQRSVDNICWRVIDADIIPRGRIGLLIEDPIFHALMVIALTRLGIVTVSTSDRNVSWPITLDAVIADRPIESPAGKTIVADTGWTAGDERPLPEKHLYRAAPDDVCRAFLTSWNGGRQTAIAMTHGMIATRLDRQKLLLGSRATFCDRTHLDLPLATPLGFQVMLGTLWRGGALVMTWDARKTLAALAAYNIQNIIAAPQGLLKITDSAESNPGYRSALTAVFSTGGLAAESAERIRARLSSNLTVGYVASDATMVAAMPAQLASGIPGAVGYVLPGVMVEIVDDEDRAVPPGEEGNLRIRSDDGVNGYLDDPSTTQRMFRNGWFYPGDRGRLTSDRVLVLSGGVAQDAAVDVERVEEILSKHANVMQCAVLAVNESGAEKLCALVVPRSYLDAEALRGYCGALLPSDLVPARFVALSDLPRTNDGKINRGKLPQLLKTRLN